MKKPKPTKAERRVAIAKDVLAQLRLERYVATEGVYVDHRVAELASTAPDKPLEKLLPQVKSCEVCALGACFLSAVRKYNDVKAGEIDDPETFMRYDGSMMTEHMFNDTTMRTKLARHFTDAQTGLIESAFERMPMGSLTDEGAADAIDFGHCYDTDHDRLVAIMKNIVKNDGTFKPGRAQV